MGYKSEIFIDGNWVDDGLVFATDEEAAAYGKSISKRRSIGTPYRTKATDAVVNYRWQADALVLGAGPPPVPTSWEEYVRGL